MYQFVDYSKTYPNGNLAFLKADFSFNDCGLVLISGNSGSGKTSLLNCICGLDQPDTGKIFHDETEVDSLLDYSAFFFQENKLFENLSVIDNLRITTDKDDQAIEEILEILKIRAFSKDIVCNLSGGQRSRVGIARALLQEENILVFDEPFANLDSETIGIICDCLKQYAAKKLILISSHQKVENTLTFDTVIRIDDEHQIHAEKKNEVSTAVSPVSHSKKLNCKKSFKLLKSILKVSKLKTAMTAVFIFFSYLFLSVVFSLATIDEAGFTYRTYRDNQIDKVEFCTRYYSLKVGVSDEILDIMNPETIRYCPQMFYFKNADGDNFVVNDIEISHVENLGENEAVLYSGYPEDQSIGQLYYADDLEIRVVRSESVEESRTLAVNEATFEKLNGNLYGNHEIVIKSSSEEATTSYLTYNPQYVRADSYYDTALLCGNLPDSPNEIVIPKRLCEDYFSGLSYEEILSQEGTFSFVKRYNTYTGEKQFDSKTFTVVGISEQILFFDETATREMLTDYGKQRIDNSEKTIFFEEYTKEIFQKAYKHNLVANGTAADSSEATLSTLLFFKNVFFIIGGIFAVISVFSLLNHVISSLTKFKKEIAVLLCFKVEKSSIFNVFLLDSLFPIVLAFILILPFNALVNTIVNHIFSDYYKLILTPMTLRFGFIALILGITVVELVLSLTALLLKISKMNRAASLKNNDSLK